METRALRAQKRQRSPRVTRTALRRLRKRMGMSTLELARRLGYSHSYIKCLESGALPITPQVEQQVKKLEQDARKSE